MINILVITEQYWPEGGGGTLATHLILKLLSASQDLQFLILSGTRRLARLRRIRYMFTHLLKTSNKITLWRNLFLLARQEWFRELLRWADIVYVPRYCYPIIPFAKQLGRKVVVHLHDYQPITYNATILYSNRNTLNLLDYMRENVRYEIMEHGSMTRAITTTLLLPSNALTRLWLREADEIICVSRRQYKVIASITSELYGRLRVIHNPIPNVPVIKKRLGTPTFLYLGGDSYVKGFYIFLGTSQKILKKHSNVRFLLAGSFKKINKLLLKRLSTKTKKAYNLLGRLKHENILKLHRISYALLFPSICEEPLPYAVLESMLAGTIPIASRVGGVPEIVEGTPADKTMFMPGNVDELVDRIEAVLSISKEQLIDIGSRLREAVLGKFDNERIKQELLKVFTM